MIPAVVLAAGTSSRYAGGNKLLVEFNGLPLIAWVVARLHSSARPIVVVTGHQANRIRRTLRHTLGPMSAMRFVHNPNYRDGMAGSLKTGIEALPPWASKVYLCLGDMPGIDARILRRLRAAWQADLDLVRCTRHGRLGHPVLINARLFSALRTLTGDQGAKLVLAEIPPAHRRYLICHAGCIMDTDTPAAMRRAALWVNTPPAKAGSIGRPADYTTWKSSSGSGSVCSSMYLFHTSSVTLPLIATQ